MISIHAPLAGCDMRTSSVSNLFCISIHAPLAGCDDQGKATPEIHALFQSTHPLRGATATLTWQRSYEQFQSTHPLRGAT